MSNKTNRRGKPPLKEIDWSQFEKLCALHCTLEEITAFFEVSDDTIERACKRHYKKSFAEISREKRGLGKLSLRRKMYETAMRGDKTLLIWLSKNYMGMTDKVAQTVSVEDKTNKGFVFLEDKKNNDSDNL